MEGQGEVHRHRPSRLPVGLLLANLLFLGSVHLPDTWAWRLPFLLSMRLVVVGVIIRTGVPESPVFDDVTASGEIVKNRSCK